VDPGKLSTFEIVLRYVTGGPRALFDSNWRSGCRRSALTVTAGLVVMFVATVLLQSVCTPWGRSLTGKGTLTGDWVGLVTIPEGQPKPIFVHIEGLIWGVDECMRGCDVQGIVQVCRAADVIQGYVFDGDVADRRGRRFRISTSKRDDQPYGWRLGDLKGEWAGGDKLLLAGEWLPDKPSRRVRVWIDAEGIQHLDMPPPDPAKPTPVAFSLRRGREQNFHTACRESR
jgi:hypothetical protein